MTDTDSQKKGNSRANSPNKDRGGAQSKQSNHGARKNVDYHSSQLLKLQENLQREKSQIKKPKRQKHVPYTFVPLGSYCSTKIVSEVILKEPTLPNGYTNRQTAQGLIDPWVDHSMDQNYKLANTTTKSSKSPYADSDAGNKKGEKKKKGGKKSNEGSTRLPKFPAVSVPAGDLTTKTLYYSDVPMLRQQLREKYSQNAGSRVDEEYTRTKQDYYRMDLDKLEEIHPLNRDHMRETYFAYLQNNPGSKKAIQECVKETEKEMKDQESASHAGSRPNSARSQRSRPTSSRSKQSENYKD